MTPDDADLPPPAFPPNSPHAPDPPARGRGRKEPEDLSAQEGGHDAQGTAASSTEEKGRGVPDDAFISPDDPLPQTRQPVEDGEWRVQRVGDPPRTESLRRREQPTIHELPYLLDRLAERINASGERALRVHPDTGHFEASLCSFLRGYLSGSEE